MRALSREVAYQNTPSSPLLLDPHPNADHFWAQRHNSSESARKKNEMEIILIRWALNEIMYRPTEKTKAMRKAKEKNSINSHFFSLRFISLLFRLPLLILFGSFSSNFVLLTYWNNSRGPSMWSHALRTCIANNYFEYYCYMNLGIHSPWSGRCVIFWPISVYTIS